MSNTVFASNTKLRLLLVSIFALFLELACIRWFPAHVIFLSFFTNIVLLASFLGLSIGCLAAKSKRDYLYMTPFCLLVPMAASFGILYLYYGTKSLGVDVGGQLSPQFVFFGTEGAMTDISRFVVPIEVIGAFYFTFISLAFIGPGQELGRALNSVTNRIHAYALNILGSIIGIVLFGLASLNELSPRWWFSLVVVLLAFLLFPRFQKTSRATLKKVSFAGLLAVIVLLASVFTGERVEEEGKFRQHFWSPYYRVDYRPPPRRSIAANLIGYQTMSSHTEPFHAYAIPHILNRDAGRTPFENVLVIGAGSGNDLSRILQWGAKHIDAVEIDPVIQRLGAKDHPDRPYDDPRVTLHLDDGRNFLRSTQTKYDLVVYALVDSLILHSGYSNIRLESFLFTQQAYEDVKRHLKPNGIFVLYNFFRQGWIVSRIADGLKDVFGTDPILLTYPYTKNVVPEEKFDGFSILIGGSTAYLKEAFAKDPDYLLAQDPAPSPQSENGFNRARERGVTDKDSLHVGPAKLEAPRQALKAATDDWPFLYLHNPMLPAINLKAMAVMGSIALLLLFLFLPKVDGKRSLEGWSWRMFFLGAGFMLVETKAVVQMALLLGSTWMVNSVVFFIVLVMILAANLFIIKFAPDKLGLYFVGLLISLALNAVIPLDFFLGMGRVLQIATSGVLVFTPVFFAGIIFGVSFSRTKSADLAFGSNIAGSVVGGLAEYFSMLVGFNGLVWFALGFYLLSWIVVRSPAMGRSRQSRFTTEPA